jgi:hypothetical protein
VFYFLKKANDFLAIYGFKKENKNKAIVMFYGVRYTSVIYKNGQREYLFLITICLNNMVIHKKTRLTPIQRKETADDYHVRQYPRMRSYEKVSGDQAYDREDHLQGQR